MLRRLHSSTLAHLALAAGLFVVPACKKKRGSDVPGTVDLEATAAQKKKNARATSLVGLANEDLRTGRYVSATKRAQEALEANPKDADAHAIMGAARWRAGDFDGSTEAFERALELDGTNFGAIIGLGQNLQAKGDHAGAIALQDKLLTQDSTQVDPMLTKLRSLYATVQPDEAIKLLDEIFKYLPAEDPQLPVVQAHAAFVRALEGQKGLLTVEGSTGSSDLGVNADMGLKHSLALVGGKKTRVVFLEIREEAIVDPKVAKRLKLKELGKMQPPGMPEPLPVVVVPEVTFGKLSIKNVPALVQKLEDYESLIGDVPIVLGRQAMQKLGSITFDYKGQSLKITADAPESAPKGASELPFLLLDLSVLHAPAVPMTIDGSEHEFFVYFGGIYKSAVAVTRKHYLKSGYLPRHLEDLDDPNAGLKMVYVSDVNVGDIKVEGVGGLVFVNEPPDETLGQVLQATAFELGGYVNMALIQNWKVTYALSSGKIFVSG